MVRAHGYGTHGSSYPKAGGKVLDPQREMSRRDGVAPTPIEAAPALLRTLPRLARAEVLRSPSGQRQHRAFNGPTIIPND